MKISRLIPIRKIAIQLFQSNFIKTSYQTHAGQHSEIRKCWQKCSRSRKSYCCNRGSSPPQSGLGYVLVLEKVSLAVIVPTELSEEIGEQASDFYITTKFPGAKKIFPPDGYSGPKQGILDLVYEHGDRYIIVEAKGGSSQLGGAKLEFALDKEDIGKYAQQGTREYLYHIIRKMGDVEKGGMFPDLSKKLLKALSDKRVDYLMVKQGFKDTTNLLKDIEIKEFSLIKK